MVLTYSSRGKDKENRSYYYKCNKKYTMYKCNNANVNGPEIENFVIDKIKVCDKDVLVNEYKKLKIDFSNLKKDNGMLDIQKQIDDKEKAIEQLVLNLSETNNATVSKYILSQIEKLGDEVDNLKVKLDDSSVVENNIDAEILNIDLIIDNLERFNKCIDEASVEEKKVLVSSVVDRVVWDGDNGEVIIVYHGFDEEQFKDNCLHLDTESICMAYIKSCFFSTDK